MYLRGSEWRKWDLHIHTPDSIEQEYGENNKNTWDKFIDELEKLDVKVLGINDYWFIDGYKKVLEYKKQGRLQNIELILPVIEIRLKCLVGNYDKTKKINYHIIFSDNISLDLIEKEFIEKLEIENYSGVSLNKDNLRQYGEKLKKEKNLSNENALKIGFNNLSVSIEKVKKILQKDIFKDNYLLAIGKNEWMDFNKSSFDIKKSLINNAHLVFTASKTLESFNKSKENLKKMGVNDLLIHCSDAHSFSDGVSAPKKLGHCFTWIKADPTFEGLKQILYESENRVFIGDKPELLKRVRENSTKFIEKIKIDWDDNYNGEKGIWFKDIEIPLNYGMVSIIGNKGNGKSALADIIALCGNSHRKRDDFAFLRKDRFLNEKLAKNFKATLEWKNNECVIKNLDDEINFNEVEKVRYIPQGFFENLTNQIEEKEFEREIEKIVFSHLPEEDKLNKSTFQELVEYKKRSIEDYILSLKEKLIKINEVIINLEKMKTKEYVRQLEDMLKQKKQELEEIEKLKPKEVDKPKIDNNFDEIIENFRKEKDNTFNQISNKENKLKEISIDIEKLEKLKNDYLLIKDKIEEVNKNNLEILQKYNLQIDEIVKFVFNEKLVNEIIVKKYKEKEEVKKEINQLKSKIKDLEKIEKEIKLKIDEPIRLYQEYLENLRVWKEKKKKIIGDVNSPHTLKWLESKLSYIKNELNIDLKEKEKERLYLVRDIFEKKQEVIKIYSKFKNIIDKEISSYKNLLGEYKIKIDTILKLDESFIDDFLNYINKKARGKFQGIENAEIALREIISRYNSFEKLENIENFLKDLLLALKEENIFRQIKENKINDFFNFLFSLDYLQPTYRLKLGDKDLNTLSPGERGALLIVFYLMLDKDDVPLIIDQPEENLDNESIYKVLVNFIKIVKRKRQIIIITHNPNLAIVGDSDQIIYVKIDKQNKNKFSFEAGSIENPKINEICSRILEGTIKAFDIRRLKYLKV